MSRALPLLALLAAAGWLARKQAPEVQRYLRVRQM
jgi:hypothetical protein